MRRGACLNVFAVQNPEYADRGIARYVAEHARALLAVAPELVHSLRASPDMALTPNLAGLLDTGLVQRTHAEPLDADARAPAIAHVTSPLEWGFPIADVWPAWAQRPEVATVVTLYDLIPLLFADRYLPDGVARVAYEARLQLVRSAEHVFAISERTAADAVSELGVPEQRITVIDAGVSDAFADSWPRRDDAVAFVREHHAAIDRPFVFYVAGADPRKNVPGLLRAWAALEPALRDAHRLVITCQLSPQRRAELERESAAAGLRRGELVLTGHVGDRALSALYRACEVFVFASLYEGSGLPILEAMKAGAPVLAAATGTGPEILGDLDAAFDPSDPLDMSAAISRALCEPGRLERLRERSAQRVGLFTWEHVARRTAEGYEAVLRRRGRRVAVRRLRPRIALVAPGPRGHAAVDDAWDRLAALWSRRVDVRLVRDGDERALGSTELRLARKQGRIDGVAAVLGDGVAHAAGLEALLDGGGIALFEHVELSGLFRWYGRPEGEGSEWLRRTLVEQYGPIVPAPMVERGYATIAEAHERGLLFTQEPQRLASAAIVPSVLAGRLLEADRRGAELPAPVLVVPPLPPAAGSPPPRRANPAEPLLLSPESPGGSGAVTLLEAVGLLHTRTRPTLSLLGEPAGATSLPAWVDVPARLTPAGRAARLLRADVAVLPAVVSDARRIAFAWECMAAGVPIVAAGGGWADELPEGVVHVAGPSPSPPQLADAIARVLADRPPTAAAAAHLELVAADAERRWMAVLDQL